MLKRNDLYILLLLIPLALSGLYSDPVALLKQANSAHPLLSSFIKFALLATLGEIIGQRISSGSYNLKNFGVIPKAIVWGVFGIFVKLSFTIFATGVPTALYLLNIHDAKTILAGPLTSDKLIIAFSISLAINMIFGSWLMILHKITDEHIKLHGGQLTSLIKPINFGYILTTMDWEKQWSFVLKKTIPLFWIPAHTLTFLLPEQYRILFAAFLGVILGIILALANTSHQNANQPLTPNS